MARKPSTAKKADSAAAKRKTARKPTAKTASKSKLAPTVTIPANRTGTGKFKPGVSGNPSGRPKEINEVRDLARQHTTEAILRLAEWMKSDNAKASVAACNALLDRAWGKATQVLANDPDHPLMPVLNVSYG